MKVVESFWICNGGRANRIIHKLCVSYKNKRNFKDNPHILA